MGIDDEKAYKVGDKARITEKRFDGEIFVKCFGLIGKIIKINNINKFHPYVIKFGDDFCESKFNQGGVNFKREEFELLPDIFELWE